MTTRLALASLLAMVPLLAGCGGGAPQNAAAGMDTVAVETATATSTVAPEVGHYSGTIQGARRVPLSTKMMGTVTRLDVEEGDRVEKGQTLARIRSQNVEAKREQVRARLREARASLENARVNFERMKALHEKESATQKELDDARTAYERAQAGVEALESRLAEVEDMLAYATVSSPIDGYVVEKRSEAGALAAPGRPLLVVETLDELKAVVQVPAESINEFSVGDSVAVEIGAAGDAVRRGVVSQINPAGSYASRQFQVQVRLPRTAAPSEAGGRRADLKSGMYARVRHQTGSHSTLTVPDEALVRRGQLTALFTVADGKALLRYVRTGTRSDGRVEILSGLRPGETYVADATPRIVDGQPVR